MAKEIERKFLGKYSILEAHTDWKYNLLHQSYLLAFSWLSLRIRTICSAKHIVTIKTGKGLVRGEYEFTVSRSIAKFMHTCSFRSIRKARYKTWIDTYECVVDIIRYGYCGAGDKMLVLVEFEFRNEKEATEYFEMPSEFKDHILKEVTDDPRYLNQNLAKEYGAQQNG